MTTALATAPETETPAPAQGRSGKVIYRFGRTHTEGDATKRALLGGKGANLAEMSALGLPVPPGFTITTEVCGAFEKAGGKLPADLMPQVRRAVGDIESESGKSFGSPHNPLL